jgi:hypothetical protein
MTQYLLTNNNKHIPTAATCSAAYTGLLQAGQMFLLICFNEQNLRSVTNLHVNIRKQYNKITLYIVKRFWLQGRLRKRVKDNGHPKRLVLTKETTNHNKEKNDLWKSRQKRKSQWQSSPYNLNKNFGRLWDELFSRFVFFTQHKHTCIWCTSLHLFSSWFYFFVPLNDLKKNFVDLRQPQNVFLLKLCFIFIRFLKFTKNFLFFVSKATSNSFPLWIEKWLCFFYI